MKGRASFHSGEWEGHDIFRQKNRKYPDPGPPPTKNVPSQSTYSRFSVIEGKSTEHRELHSCSQVHGHNKKSNLKPSIAKLFKFIESWEIEIFSWLLNSNDSRFVKRKKGNRIACNCFCFVRNSTQISIKMGGSHSGIWCEKNYGLVGYSLARPDVFSQKFIQTLNSGYN